ncbi:MAG: hypothetical protein ACO3IX_06810 [Flavobacteriaceae bacterium]
MSLKFDLKIFSALLMIGLVMACSTEDAGILPGVEDPETPPPPPSSSALSLPANNEACEGGQGVSSSTATVSFSWSAATNATSYDLSVTNGATNAVSTKNNITGTSTTIDLERGQTYSWKVTSKNKSSSTADSPTWSFTLASMPGVSSLSLPENDKACEVGEVNGNLAAVSFSWEAAENSDLYDIVLTNQTTNESTTFSDIEGTETSLELERAHAYTWKVIAKNCANSNENGATWQFYLAGEAEQNAAPFAASAVSPTPGSTATPTEGKVTIEWDASDPDEDELSYTLEVSTSDSFAAADTTSFADLTEKSQAVDVTSGVYYWRVTVADESISVTSDVFSFRVE